MRGGRLGGGAKVPEGTLVARVCPFDPAYWAFVDLCRECAGNRWLPRIELAADLEGGGSVVFLEFAAPVDHAVAGQVAEQWRTASGDAEFEEARRAAQVIDAGYRKSTPWWGRCDLNEAHIRRAADGRLVLIDVFCMDGASLYREILEDVAGVHRRIPRERMRYALDIPYIPGRTVPPRSLPSERPGHALAGERSRVCQGTSRRCAKPLPNNGSATPVSPQLLPPSPPCRLNPG